MARRVFFSFHFDRDSWRVGQVRNCNVVTNNYIRNDFVDSAIWEAVKSAGDTAIKNWINNQLKGTSVTIVLIGNQTNERKYVHYEIEQSIAKGNGFLGIYVHNIKNQHQMTDFMGSNPLDAWQVRTIYGNQYLSQIFRTYDWVLNDGRTNIYNWVEEAARIAGK
ncbi:MAG: TIR domain-containing protein [Melioribacteraceae bacterium]|nr:MAG: TIR domain-containing protein [Melioribacteraceae bacterium]